MQCSCSPLADQGPACPWAVISTSQPTPPRLFTGCDVLWYGIFLWPVQVSWSGCGHTQLLMLMFSGSMWETGEFLTWGKHNLATPESVTNVILILNPNHSTIPGTRKKFPSQKQNIRPHNKYLHTQGRLKNVSVYSLGKHVSCLLNTISGLDSRGGIGGVNYCFQDTVPNYPCSGKWRPHNCLQHLVSAK